jgi:hypothetical protein
MVHDLQKGVIGSPICSTDVAQQAVATGLLRRMYLWRVLPISVLVIRASFARVGGG